MRTLLALDLGSSSVRALVLEHDSVSAPSHLVRRPIELRVGPGGQADLDPEAYLQAVVQCIDELCRARCLESVSDVVVSSQWHSLVAVDRHTGPISPLLTWADSRGIVTALSAADVAAMHSRTGAWPHQHYWTGKVPWLLEQVAPPDLLLGLPEFLTLRLLGDPSMSPSIASGTGLLDWSAGVWDDEALRLAGVRPGLLPSLQEQGWLGSLLPQWKRRWPSLADAVWHPPVGDGAAANVGAGCVDRSSINVTIGTSAAVRVVEPLERALPVPSTLWRYRVDDHRVVTGMAFSSGGASYAWARRLVGIEPSARDAPGLADVPAGSGGVVVLAFHAGSRAPRDVRAGSGTVAGLALDSTPLQVVSAVMESVCFEIAEAVCAVEAATGETAQVVACGGALEASDTWQLRLASVLGRPISVIPVPEASARGAAIISLGAPTRQRQRGRQVDPRPRDVEPLRAARAAYEELRRAHGIAPVAESTKG